MVKSDSIDTLRCIAIVLVVGFHISLDPELDSSRDLYNQFAYFFMNIRLPLFTIISGYLYAVRPISGGKFRFFIRGKARRILVPLIVVSSIEYLIISLAPGINNPASLTDIWKIYLFSYEQYWFLQSIFLIFVFVAALDAMEFLGIFSRYLAILATTFIVAYLLYYHNIPFTIFSLDGSIYLLPYFLIGLGIRRFSNILNSNKAGILSTAVFALLILLQFIFWRTDYESFFMKREWLGMAIGASAGISLFYLKPALKPMAWLGGYAYTIYLYQSFGAGFARRVFEGLDARSDHLYFLSVLVVTLFAGVVVEEVIKRIPYVRKLLLGLK